MKFLHKLPEQAVRVVVVFVVLAAVLFVVRQFIIPPEMKEMTLIQAATMEREADKEIKYAGAAICAQCHEKQQEMKKTGYHRDLACESCHGAAQKHVDNPTEVKPTSPRKRDYCVYCHTYNSSRPTGFPQINPDTHNPRKPCITCHNPHNPKPPQTAALLRGLSCADRTDQGGVLPCPSGLHRLPHHAGKAQDGAPGGDPDKTG